MADGPLAEKRNIVLGITGSIAAYKAAELARLLVSRGYAIRTVMTESATKICRHYDHASCDRKHSNH